MNDNLVPYFTILFALLIFIAALVPAIFFVLTLQKTLNVISPESRRMRPGQVWLLLIPFFNLVWLFITVSRIADSIKNESMRLHITTDEGRPTYGIGLIMCIFYVTGSILYQLRFIPLTGAIFSLAGIICWILYWIKVNDYKNLILSNKDNFMFDAERESFPLNR
ncbi:hypothetical protein DC498_04380 [Terrimonas sp.]|uniref:DUF4328 domain-containing protein n=1 Tax=Terrimonas sp. TaxID=1914338 RepID=UPI000D522E6F|nr:DUF4328 domain-containing protein [Terrimonas sp.]PVD53752.1 hypothetical protein DC498_04380 [Terrimonas sp.]